LYLILVYHKDKQGSDQKDRASHKGAEAQRAQRIGKDKRKRRKEKNREAIPIPIAKPEKKRERKADGDNDNDDDYEKKASHGGAKAQRARRINFLLVIFHNQNVSLSRTR
jgi:hypothetical protein